MAPSNMVNWQPYERNTESLARYWAIPGMAGYEHRIGGLEKQEITGNVSYDPDNHQKMTDLREEKVQRVANYIPELVVDGEQEGDLLIVGWGGTYGSLFTALNKCALNGKSVGLAHFNYIKPLPANTAEVFSKFKKIVVCELNSGQFVKYLQGELPEFTYQQFNKVQGLPFTVSELTNHFTELLKS